MNWTQLICAICGLAVAALVGIFLNVFVGPKHIVRNEITSIGRELIATTNSESLASLPPELKRELQRLLSSRTRLSEVSLGDRAAPIGDGQATGHIVLSNESGASIGIRLKKKSSAAPQFEVSGYWTNSEPQPAITGREGRP
jgi:hypothetical protein